MHSVVGVIIYAKDDAEALAEGESVYEQICGEGHPYDWFTLFNDKTATTSGTARWGSIPAIIKADSPEGKKFINDRMKWHRDGFKEHFVELLNEIVKTKKESKDIDTIVDKLIENHNARYLASCLSGYSNGSDIYLYDNDGEAIIDKTHLKRTLNKWADNYTNGKNPHDGQNVYIIPADVHQ